MKDSEIYLRAAKLIDEGVNTYSCIAMRDAANHIGFVMSIPLARDYYHIWGFESSNDLQHNIEIKEDGGLFLERKQLRVLLLCLASAIAEEEGR
jgi:hypothetical protein